MSFIPVLEYLAGIAVFGFTYWLMDNILTEIAQSGITLRTGNTYDLLFYLWVGILFIYLIFGGWWLVRKYNEKEYVGLQMKKKKLLAPDKLFNVDIDILKGTIRSSGYYNQKAQKIKNFLVFFKNYNFNFNKLAEQETEFLREQLLSIKGIGEETADCILLYALEKPVFVIDA